MQDKFDKITIRTFSNWMANNFTHKQISEEFQNVNIKDITEGQVNKQDRVYNSLLARQDNDGCGNNILNLIQTVISPRRYGDEMDFEKQLRQLNEMLSYEGIEIGTDGKAFKVNKAKTVSEAKGRAVKVKQKVHGLSIHSDIIPYCEEQYLKENYFHAILEITKSVAEKLRTKSGYTTDGSELVENCFGLGGDKRPMLAFNALLSLSEESEHKGFSNFIKGFFSMYRNPTAHSPKISENYQLEEMSEVLVVATIIHNKLDKTFKTGYK